MNNSTPYTLSVIVPVYNEQDNLAPLITEIERALAQQRYYEIIYVDDGSSDGTAQQLKQLQAQHSKLKVIKHLGNFGQSASIVSGVRAAQYEWIVTLDGDGQNDPADINLLLTACAEQKSYKTIIVGNRAKRDDSWLRKLSSRIGNGVRNTLLKDDCPDTGCSLKLFPRQAFLNLPHFNHLHRYIPALFKRAGYRVINVPVSHRPRTRGVSKYGVMNRLWVGIFDLMGMMWLIRRPCQPELKND